MPPNVGIMATTRTAAELLSNTARAAAWANTAYDDIAYTLPKLYHK